MGLKADSALLSSSVAIPIVYKPFFFISLSWVSFSCYSLCRLTISALSCPKRESKIISRTALSLGLSSSRLSLFMTLKALTLVDPETGIFPYRIYLVSSKKLLPHSRPINFRINWLTCSPSNVTFASIRHAFRTAVTLSSMCPRGRPYRYPRITGTLWIGLFIKFYYRAENLTSSLLKLLKPTIIYSGSNGSFSPFTNSSKTF